MLYQASTFSHLPDGREKETPQCVVNICRVRRSTGLYKVQAPKAGCKYTSECYTVGPVLIWSYSRLRAGSIRFSGELSSTFLETSPLQGELETDVSCRGIVSVRQMITRYYWVSEMVRNIWFRSENIDCQTTVEMLSAAAERIQTWC